MTGAIGAYGLRVTGVDQGLLSTVPDHYPALQVQHRAGPCPVTTSAFDDARAAFALDDGRGVVLDRDAAVATCWGSTRASPADRVHPLLTSAAAVFGRWHGYELFHAAAFVSGAGAWGVLGTRGSGKSTLAACLHGMGVAVVCDDLLAVSGSTAFAGPRCIDLRRPAAQYLGVGTSVPTASLRERWRVVVRPVDAEMRLRGWVFLSWADEIDVVTVSTRDRLLGLGANRTWRGTPIDPVVLLQLAALTAFELRRPRSLSSLGDAAEALCEATIGAN